MTEDPELLSDAQVAVLLRLSPRTLADWRQRGKGPPWMRIGGKTILYPTAELRVWLVAQKLEAA